MNDSNPGNATSRPGRHEGVHRVEVTPPQGAYLSILKVLWGAGRNCGQSYREYPRGHSGTTRSR
jgi:hypothetical protein